MTSFAQAAPGRVVLDQQRIVQAALELLDEAGIEELSMRRLGRRLGVEAMALYRYWPSREALLDGVVEAAMDELFADPDVQLGPEDGWQDYLRRLAHGVRRLALRHPQVFPLVATRPPAAPWIRPPLRSLRWVESFLEALLSREFSDEDALYAYRAFSSFLLGHLLLEVSALGVDIAPVEIPEGERTAQVRLDDSCPELLRLASRLAEDHSLVEFEDSLDNLLDRLDERLHEASR